MDRIREITLELKDRNYDSFDEFYNSTSKLVYHIIIGIVRRREVAEDIMQDTYTKFLESIDSVSISNSPQAYLVQIARNMAINHYNKNKREVFDDVFIDEQLQTKEESRVSLGIIDYLNGYEKEIVTMHIIGDMKFKDIAKAINKPLGTVLWAYNKAIKYLKKKVGEQDEK